MGIQDFPSDLLLYLLSTYLLDDILAVKSCSLVCKRLREVFQPQVLRNIVVRYSSHGAQGTAVGQNIESTFASIAPHIRHLTISCNVMPLPDTCVEALEKEVVAQLPQMRKLATLVISGDKLPLTHKEEAFLVLDSFKYRSIPPLTSIRVLVLHKIYLPISTDIFWSFPNLDTLALVGIVLENSTLPNHEGHSSEPQKRSAIQDLTVHLFTENMTFFLKWGGGTECQLDLTDMKNFRVSMAAHKESMVAMRDVFLPSCGQALETLDLHLFDYPTMNGGGKYLTRMFDIADALPNLKQLRFKPDAKYYYQSLGKGLPGFSSWLPKFLAQFRGCQHLSEIEVSCDFSQDALLELPGTPSWLKLGNLWHEVDHGHALGVRRKFTFYLPERQGRQNVVSKPDIVRLIKERLPLFRASDLLRFEIEAWPGYDPSRRAVKDGRPPVPL